MVEAFQVPVVTVPRTAMPVPPVKVAQLGVAVPFDCKNWPEVPSPSWPRVPVAEAYSTPYWVYEVSPVPP